MVQYIEHTLLAILFDEGNWCSRSVVKSFTISQNWFIVTMSLSSSKTLKESLEKAGTFVHSVLCSMESLASKHVLFSRFKNRFCSVQENKCFYYVCWLGNISILIMKKYDFVEPYVVFRCLKYHRTLTNTFATNEWSDSLFLLLSFLFHDWNYV